MIDWTFCQKFKLRRSTVLLKKVLNDIHINIKVRVVSGREMRGLTAVLSAASPLLFRKRLNSISLFSVSIHGNQLTFYGTSYELLSSLAWTLLD